MLKTSSINITSKKIAKDIIHHPKTINHDATMTDFAKKLRSLDVSRLIIEKDGKHIGIATTKDLAFYLYMNKSDKAISNIPVTKMLHDIIFIDENTPISLCAEIMLDARISSLAIGSKGCVQGIFTMTDIIQYYEYQLPQEICKVDDCNSSNYLSLDSNVNAPLALDAMIVHEVSRIIVQNNDKIPKGIVTLGDFMNPLIADDSSNSKNSKNYIFDETLTLGDLMSDNLISVPINTDLKTACKTLLESHVDAIVITKEDNTIEGVLNKTDIMRAICSLEYQGFTKFK
jgi:predicted transcriptional regulator